MEQTATPPATTGQADKKDYKTEGEWAVIRCPFCHSPGRDEKPTFHIHLKMGKFCCTCCWIFGMEDDLKSLASGEDLNELRNKRRKEYRMQTVKNCKKYGFAPAAYEPLDPYTHIDFDTYRFEFQKYDHPAVKRWLEKMGISAYPDLTYGLGLWVTELHEFEEHGVLVPNPNIAFRGLVMPNSRGKELVRFRIITCNGTMSFPENLDPIPLIMKSLPTDKRIYFIVKNDLEALLLRRCSWKFSVVGLGDPGVKLDRELHYTLRNSDLILISIDNEKEGKSDHSEWWLRIYPQARWYPYPIGKNLIEARLQGLGLQKWAREGVLAW